ncbi:B3 domain-containing protein Os01g0234100 [Daucus carota subsp. sativus]|uniref:B3 domain-containing protein Os01g0234100 n=1 Tax=Daucus carota subsp. sativus TaxID=79200 RepID=UPI0007EFAE3B|nr:PREDICTED: B3 domain-containing protein Os01g0234100-like isoform X1 [Daucus carota subsp. sativus]
MAIPRAQPSSKNNKALDTKKKILKNREHKTGIAPKVETGDGHEFDGEKSSPMDRALEIQANLASKFPSFVKNMLPSHVAGGFWLGLPKKFSEMHLPKHDKTVVLVDETELEHETKYLAEKTGLSGGWRGFSIAHKLKEKDVLVFHLIQECKFKVYIVRANALSEIDGAISLLNLGARVTKMNGEGLKITVMAPEEHFNQYSPVHSVQEKDMVALRNNVDAAADNYKMDTDNSGSDDVDGIRFAHSVVDFKDVKGYENFSIIVDRLIIDCEIPHDLRVKYYELCCSQNSYLHDELIDGLNLRLVVGVIFEIISIADAIRSSKTRKCEDLKAWDNSLKAFEILGMKVGFLRARINKLLILSSDLEDALKRKIVEKAKAEEELEVLEIKRSRVKELIENSDYEIQAMKKKSKNLEAAFLEESQAPW